MCVCTKMDHRQCIACLRSISRSNNSTRRSYLLTAQCFQQHPFLIDFLAEVINIREIANGDRICKPCFQQARRYVQRHELDTHREPVTAGVEPSDVDDEPERPGTNRDTADDEREMADGEPEDQEPIVAVEQVRPARNVSSFLIQGFTRAPFNTKRCIFQYCENRNLIRIDKNLRSIILQEKSFYIPQGSRVCEQHRFDPVWIDIELVVRHVYNTFSPKQVSDMLRLLQKKQLLLNFERLSSISVDIFHYYIGFSKTQFTEVLECTPSISNTHKKPATALATLLVKLHTGEPNQRLCKIFHMARSTFEYKMNSVRDYLLNEFVPRHLGHNHITREEVISRCLAIPKALFGGINPEETAITIHDGTYIYLQKSSNYSFQRKSYSLHKYRQLYKPYLMVCPDGHIIDIVGPYDATTSDATILSGMLQRQNDPINWFYRPNDVFKLDRGFRDALNALELAGYIGKMPIASTRRGTSQLSTADANKSRMVTLCRWVVETMNGRLKNQFKLIRHTANNRAMGHLFSEIKIAGALLNAFGRPLTDHRLVEAILSAIEATAETEKYLGDYIINKNINARRAVFLTITAEDLNHIVHDFPVLSMDELIIYALGTYQIKQARSYYGEHIKNDDGTYKIEVCRDMDLEGLEEHNITVTNPWLLRARIQSRHRQSRIYYTYILIEGGMGGRQAICAHYCSCIIGKRTLGCCSHVMSVLWYLAWGRYQENLFPPATLLDDIIIRHDVENEAEESSEDEL